MGRRGRKRVLEGYRLRWEDSIKMDLREIWIGFMWLSTKERGHAVA
jgi:hypothetical protein